MKKQSNNIILGFLYGLIAGIITVSVLARKRNKNIKDKTLDTIGDSKNKLSDKAEKIKEKINKKTN